MVEERDAGSRAINGRPPSSALRSHPFGVLAFDRKPHLDRHLIVRDLTAVDVAAGFEDFEPADIVDRARRPGDRGLDRVLDAGGGGADELDDLVDVVHARIPERKGADAPAYAYLGEE